MEWLWAHAQLEQFRNNPAKVAMAMDEYAAQKEFLINIGSDKVKILVAEVQKRKPRVLLEYGGYLGYSALLLADAMRKASPGKKVQMYSLERMPTYAAFIMSIMDLAGLGDIVKVVTDSASDAAARLKKEGLIEHVDFLFIDHLEELYVPDIKIVESLGLLTSGTVICADNVVRPGAPDYVEYVRNHPGWESRGEKGLIMPGEFEVR